MATPSNQNPAPIGPRVTRLERGFTLIEMLFVMLIASILATIFMPTYRKSRLKAEAADVLRRVEGINVAIKSYEADGLSVPVVTGPEGAPPAFLQPYVTSQFFQGPGSVSFQLVKADQGSPPTLVISAGDSDGEQLLLAAANALGPAATAMGGGAAITVSLTH